jgi:hypothetical protein
VRGLVSGAHPEFLGSRGGASERYDENCFDPDYDWLPLEHFAPAPR